MQDLKSRNYIVASVLGLIAWLLCRCFYRFFLSPLSRVPGPKLAALTTLYSAYYDVYHPGQYVFKIKELHKVYGQHTFINPIV